MIPEGRIRDHLQMGATQLTANLDIESDHDADEELQLAIGDSVNMDPDTILAPVKEDSNAMEMDEEGRPQFQPSRDIVSDLTRIELVLRLSNSNRTPSPESKRERFQSHLTA